MSKQTQDQTYQVSWVHHQGRLMIITKETQRRKVKGRWKDCQTISEKKEYCIRGESATIAIWTQIVDLLNQGHDIGNTAQDLLQTMERLADVMETVADHLTQEDKGQVIISYGEAEGIQLRATTTPPETVEAPLPPDDETITTGGQTETIGSLWDDITG